MSEATWGLQGRVLVCLLYSHIGKMSRVTKTHYQAKYEYEAAGKGQLSVTVGEKFILVSKTGDDWWTVRSSDGNLGLVPASYLEPSEVLPHTKLFHYWTVVALYVCMYMPSL